MTINWYFFFNIFSDALDSTVQNCVLCYTSDWVVVKRRYHHYSSSVRPLTGPSSLEDAIAAEENTVVRHEFEIDESANAQPTDTPDFDNVSSSNRLFF